MKTKTKDNLATDICTRLSEWRKKAGIPQHKVATMLGVKLRSYQNWEQHRRKPAGLSLIALEAFVSKAETRSHQDLIKSMR